MSLSLISPDTRIKVSSTLDKSVGKKFLTDGSPETCWTSQQGSPQYIQMLFPSPVLLRQIAITFQGGFVGTSCTVDTRASDSGDWAKLTAVYPEDVNRKQVFDVNSPDPIQSLKLTFEESSDFFGRITVYDLDVLGEHP
ncbi:galactose-binding like protein [Peniophora sp. CONT]|nr:galactose-binding like protein [Peniophora sp. CONT]